jgi:hypothetical protein
MSDIMWFRLRDDLWYEEHGWTASAGWTAEDEELFQELNDMEPSSIVYAERYDDDF